MTASLFIAGSDAPARAIDALLALDEPCGSCVISTPPTIAALTDPRGWRDRARLQLEKRLSAAHGEIRLAVPPSLARGLLPRSSDWIEVGLGGRGDRLERISLARSLFDSETLFAFTNLDRPHQRGERTTIAIGLWSHFARGLERIGARVGDDRTGLPAEIALGVVARRYFVVAERRGVALTMSSDDPIVAELAGRALLRLGDETPADEMLAPWEEPLIQRAAELKLGVQSPEEIRLCSLWQGPGADANRFATLLQELSDLISLPAPAAAESASTVLPS